VIWPHDRDKLQGNFDHLNSRQQSINFTMEENAGSIPFLVTNQLTTSVYRKKTHTNRYLHFNSYHHPRVKVGIISCLCDRAERVCSEENIKEEKNHLQEVFEANSYPPDLVRCSPSKRSKKSKGLLSPAR
jgi:L-asparaginase/Glu-tRNA(Gln) amidotransferase subunit D